VRSMAHVCSRDHDRVPSRDHAKSVLHNLLKDRGRY
jgi:hypothetical protein